MLSGTVSMGIFSAGVLKPYCVAYDNRLELRLLIDCAPASRA